MYVKGVFKDDGSFAAPDSSSSLASNTGPLIQQMPSSSYINKSILKSGGVTSSSKNNNTSTSSNAVAAAASAVAGGAAVRFAPLPEDDEVLYVCMHLYASIFLPDFDHVCMYTCIYSYYRKLSSIQPLSYTSLRKFTRRTKRLWSVARPKCFTRTMIMMNMAAMNTIDKFLSIIENLYFVNLNPYGIK